ncbi:NAD(P)H-dependent glycerol-3-phosphate dehydrogenase [Fusibacter paucivorans]|uniref:Glycerol-3-phosphate dehydrogenase [NAD(P)+] n=1 Tax=Fusibacter paucivorans TaxID=76009 RepID=A0ABS5PQE9_9FIRM|nr:NAD(P)H-dependent glycerol-3-phosphate dehydrogenase [Fusibacter paucivorans]
MLKVTVIAAGSWGTALALVLEQNGHDVTVWARRESQVQDILQSRRNDKYLRNIAIPENIQFTSSLQEAVKHTEVIVLSVPTQQLNNVLEQMAEQITLSHRVIMVNVSKGIDMGSLELPSQMVMRYYPTQPFVVLSGPSHAEEVALKLPTALVAASKNRLAAEIVQDLFSNDYMRVYTNPDVVGVEISGALKNIIALGAGISDGLGYGDNAKAALITRGINEMVVLGQMIGAETSTFRGLAGVGDLIVTCTSQHSRNRRCGILIGEGLSFDNAIESVGMVVEGAYTVKAAYRLMTKLKIDMPITKVLYRVLYEGKNAREAVNYLMTRQKKHEIDENAEKLELWQ